MATPQAKRLRSSCSDEPATPSTPQPQIPALSNSFVGKNKCSLFGGLPTPRIGCPINSVDNLELFKLQVRAIPELVEVFQTVPELSDFVWLGGSANGNEASSKFNLFSKVQPLFLVLLGGGLTNPCKTQIKSMFSSATGNATSSKKLAANETVHMMPAAADNAADVDVIHNHPSGESADCNIQKKGHRQVHDRHAIGPAALEAGWPAARARFYGCCLFVFACRVPSRDRGHLPQGRRSSSTQGLFCTHPGFDLFLMSRSQ